MWRVKEPGVTGAGGGKERFRLGLSDGVRDTSRTHGTRGLESRQLQFHQQSGPLALTALGVPCSLWNHSQGNVSRGYRGSPLPPPPASLANLPDGRGSGPEPSCQGRGADNPRRSALSHRSHGSLSLCPSTAQPIRRKRVGKG